MENCNHNKKPWITPQVDYLLHSSNEHEMQNSAFHVYSLDNFQQIVGDVGGSGWLNG